MKIGIIGGGQLGMMLAESSPENHYVFVDPNPKSPAQKFGSLVQKNFDDISFVADLNKTCDVVTYEFENVDVLILEKITKPLYPPLSALKISQDRLTEKEMLTKLGLTVAPYLKVEDKESLNKAVQVLGDDSIIKTRRFGYDGKGQVKASKCKDILSPSVAEKNIAFDKEVSQISVRDLHGNIKHYPLTENVHEQGILRTSTAPAKASKEVAGSAKQISERILNYFNYVGVLCVEFFLVGSDLIINEFAPRVHNSGHWSQDAGISSQFKNHINAICGLPLGETTIGPKNIYQMINVVGSKEAYNEVQKGDIIHDYNKEERAGRKLGHINRILKND